MKCIKKVLYISIKKLKNKSIHSNHFCVHNFFYSIECVAFPHILNRTRHFLSLNVHLIRSLTSASWCNLGRIFQSKAIVPIQFLCMRLPKLLMVPYTVAGSICTISVLLCGAFFTCSNAGGKMTIHSMSLKGCAAII